mgnify:CR=1 FL=1
MATYMIVRHYYNGPTYHRVIKRGLTLQEAQRHCKNPETSSSTCSKALGRRRTVEKGPWFDGYQEAR